jgi:hypothetical protein
MVNPTLKIHLNGIYKTLSIAVFAIVLVACGSGSKNSGGIAY